MKVTVKKILNIYKYVHIVFRNLRICIYVKGVCNKLVFIHKENKLLIILMTIIYHIYTDKSPIISTGILKKLPTEF